MSNDINDSSGLDYLQFLCCNLERAVNEMPVQAVQAPFNHLIPSVWHIYDLHTNALTSKE